MSVPPTKSQRISNLSASPLNTLKSEKKKASLKLSLLKLNDAVLHFPDSFSKPSKSQLPALNLKSRRSPQPFLEKPGHVSSLKNFKKSLMDGQSPAFSYHSPSREANASFSLKDVKAIFDEENRRNVDQARFDEVHKKREALRLKREFINKFEPAVKPKLYQSALHLALLLRTFSDEFIAKYMESGEEAKLQALDRMCEIEGCFYKIYEDFLNELMGLRETLSDSEKQKLVISQKLEKILVDFEEKMKKNNRKETPMDKENGILIFENTRLAMEIQKLNERLKVFENYDAGPLMRELESVKMQAEEKIKGLQYELNILKGKDDGHQNLVNFYKATIVKLEKDVKHWILTSGENQKIIDKLTEKLDLMRSSLFKYREISHMQLEDISVLSAKRHDLIQANHDLQDRIKLLSLKIDKLTIQKGDNVNEGDYKSDLAIISTLSDFFRENLFQKILRNNPVSVQALASIGQKAPHIAPVRSYESNSSHPTFLRKLTFLKAPFFKLVEHRFKTINYAVKSAKKPNFHELLAQIRAIFDSKFNEMIYVGDFKMISGFPEFVYSWLGKYEVNYTTKQIQKIDPFAYNTNLDDVRIQFLVELTNPKIEKLWECSTFCEFLEEKYTLDELFFYLHCRNILLKGSQLRSLSAFFDLIHFVPFERAEYLIDLIMHKYDITLRTTIKGKLSEKAKRKGPNAFIDSAFVLRILLEYYRIERIDKFNLLEELFNAKMHKDDDKDTVSFENFKKILQFNWPQLTDLETTELYREAWGVGQGSVNVESFFAVANELKFFLKTMKLPSIMTFEDAKGPYESIRAAFFTDFGGLKDKLEDIASYVNCFGVESLDEKLRKMKKIIQSEFQMPSEEMKEKFISHFSMEFADLLNAILRVASLTGLIFEDPKKEKEFLASKETFERAKKLIFEFMRDENLREIRENAIARKIQKKLRPKIKKRNNITQVVKNLKKT